MPDYSTMATCTNCPEGEGSMSQTNREYTVPDDSDTAEIERTFRCGTCGEEASMLIGAEGTTFEGRIIFEYDIGTIED